MEFIKKIVNKYKKSMELCSPIIYNINHDVTQKQLKIAVVYITKNYLNSIDIHQVYHANTIHQFQIIKTLINENYSIDIYPCSIDVSNQIRKIDYDVILGFGSNYLELCALNPHALKVLFVTENAPWIVQDKFKQRIAYFQQRYSVKHLYTVPRTLFYKEDMFNASDIGIIMNGTHNYNLMKSHFKKSYRINVNALFNKEVICHPIRKNHNLTKRNFVWFGSNGLIHKGLDILIDAFRELPDLTLNIYGAPVKELRIFSIPTNVIVHDKINIFTNSFITEVIKKNTFVLSLSCSEGMMSGVATCMVHGLIPITTLETGFDDVPNSFLFEDYTVEHVIEILKKASNLEADYLSIVENQILSYSTKNYSIESFTSKFTSIVKDLTNEIR